jgi:transglutaminase-like putative cysteine protease
MARAAGTPAAGWRLRICHRTEVRYSAPAACSVSEARMTPLSLPGQAVLQARLEVSRDSRSGRVPARCYEDCWGTRVTVFEVPEAHRVLLIRAMAVVETSVPVPVPERSRPGWDEIRAAARGPLARYARPTPLTTLSREVIAGVLPGGGLTPGETARLICARVRERVRYAPGVTGPGTTAQQAWDGGRGVCQDLAHVTVALLRAAGLPARYACGYLHPRPDAVPGVTASGRGHAWAEYWDGCWTPVDPTAGAPVAERHVVVARGRDYADVPPLKGAYRGAPGAAMDVTVEVTRLR